MKKIIKVFLLLCLSLGLVSCNKNLTEIDNSKYNYSNLASQESQEYLEKSLESSGIEKRNIDIFLNQLKDYNRTIKNQDLTGEFKAMEEGGPDYDTLKMMELWDKEKGMFIGNNCRLTSFELLKEFIEYKEEFEVSSDNLFMDMDALENDNSRNWSKEDFKKFKSLYGSMDTSNTQDVSVHLKRYTEEMELRGISFKEDTNISHIAVVFHDSLDSKLFIGHTGLLIDQGQELLFLEKLNFTEPYQLIKFHNRLELNDYLMSQYDVSYNQPEAKPFIMENNKLLDGYRPNQKNL